MNVKTPSPPGVDALILIDGGNRCGRCTVRGFINSGSTLPSGNPFSNNIALIGGSTAVNHSPLTYAVIKIGDTLANGGRFIISNVNDSSRGGGFVAAIMKHHLGIPKSKRIPDRANYPKG